MEEKRLLKVHAMGKGHYLLDITFTLTAASGKVDFVSDDIHYAWPYVRMHPRFTGPCVTVMPVFQPGPARNKIR